MSLSACHRGEELPPPTSKTYRQAVTAFYASVAAFQAGIETDAEKNMLEVTKLVPQEPSAWANLGLFALRRGEFDLAAERLQQARALAPDNSEIQTLSGRLQRMQGQLESATTYLREAVALAPHNLKAVYALAQTLEELGGAHQQAEAQRLLTSLLKVQPENLALMIEVARLAAVRNELDTLQKVIDDLAARATSWPPQAQEQLHNLQRAVREADPTRLQTHVAFLKNVLTRVPAYRQGLAAVQVPYWQGGELMQQFLRLPSPHSRPAPPDMALTFTVEPLPTVAGSWTWIGAVALNGEDAPQVMVADSREVRSDSGMAFGIPGGPLALPDAQPGVAVLDFNDDFKTDLALVGEGGLRLVQQIRSDMFTDVTARMALPASVTGVPYAGVWVADVDMDGDLDLVLGPPAGSPLGLRNNGDGTFTKIDLFAGLTGLRSFVWGDLDADGDPDAAFIDQRGTLSVQINQRGGAFQAIGLPQGLTHVLAVEVADVNRDGVLELVLLQADGKVQRLSAPVSGNTWELTEIARWSDLPGDAEVAMAHLMVADLDNNGGLDLVASVPGVGRVWLQDTQGDFQSLSTRLSGPLFAVVDLTGNGRLDLLGLSESGQPVRLVNQGVKNYGWLTLQPRAAQVAGGRRINTFAIGGEVDLRAGLLYQKQPITGPLLHFGLAEHRSADVARIIWPNGDVQAEFAVQSNRTVAARQRLKGSCPWVFAYDGEAMRFVTDFLWRSPLGLRINAQDTAQVMMTEDWIKIRGDQLVARDGFYDLRITAELWETHFVDHVSLLVVDHPAGTEVYVDERFAFPPPKLAVLPTAPPHPVARAWDDQRQDVTALVRARDGRYLGTFGPGTYQGVTRDHYVEVELGAAASPRGPLWLLATGWIRPTDSSINVAISQGHQPKPRGLQLEVPDGRGGWTVAQSNLGFPAGKAKTILIDLEGLLRPGTPRRVRLRTNMEIYWDALAWAEALPDATIETRRLPPNVAELRYRGFSVVKAADRVSPEVPDYQALEGTAPRWRDLRGYYTRFGDVRELLQTVEDRYVIMNAGDELVLRFLAPPPPPPAWQRDFVLIGDGWVKDGDYNTRFSTTVLPLPAHERSDYTAPPGTLEDDPVYRRYHQDWQTYHTRYLTSQGFQEALLAR
jgi:Flp pilus assembly protein TadD